MTSSRITSTNKSSKPRNPRSKGKAPRVSKPDPEVVGQLVLMLVRGVPADKARSAAVSELQLTAAKADAALAEAEASIVRAAAVDRQQELGLARSRLNDLYRTAMKHGEVKEARAVQKELIRLLALDNVEPAGLNEGESEAEQALAAIAAHLVPLGLAKPEYPLVEHARIAAEIVRERREPK